MKEIKSKILIDGSVLWIGKNIFWDTGSFRPDMKLYLKDKKPYKAIINFDQENLQNGDIVSYPKKLTVESNNNIFINIR